MATKDPIRGMPISPIVTIVWPDGTKLCPRPEPLLCFQPWGLDPETTRWLPLDSAEQFANDILREVERAQKIFNQK